MDPVDAAGAEAGTADGDAALLAALRAYDSAGAQVDVHTLTLRVGWERL